MAKEFGASKGEKDFKNPKKFSSSSGKSFGSESDLSRPESAKPLEPAPPTPEKPPISSSDTTSPKETAPDPKEFSRNQIITDLKAMQVAYETLEEDITELKTVKSREELHNTIAWKKIKGLRDKLVDDLQTYRMTFGRDKEIDEVRKQFSDLVDKVSNLHGFFPVEATEEVPIKSPKPESPTEKKPASDEVTLEDVKANPPEVLRNFIANVEAARSRLSEDLTAEQWLDLLHSVETEFENVKVRLVDKDNGRYRKDREYFDIKDYIESIPRDVITEIEKKWVDKIEKEEPLVAEADAELSVNVSGTDAAANTERKARVANLQRIKQTFESKYNARATSSKTTREWYNRILTNINNKVDEIQKQIQGYENRPLSPKEADRQLTKKSVETFFIRRGIPLREDKPEYKDIHVYLEKIHQELMTVAMFTLWNQMLDKSGSGAPRTVSYLLEPMTGPSQDVHLLENQLIYTKEEKQAVYNLESFLDQFKMYFDDPHEAHEAAEMAERMKEQFDQVAIWHNRAYARRKNEDNAGPDGAFKALTELANRPGLTPNLEHLFRFKPECTEAEKRFSEGIEYSMAIWSVMSLKQHERQRLWPHIDPRIKNKYFVDKDGKHEIKYEYDLLPRYRSTDDKRRHMVEEIIRDLEGMGLTKSEAQMAYHIGESYRIGSGLEAFWDVKYGTPDKPEVKVAAVEGEPKAANIGLYVESAWSNPVRPDFNAVYKDYLVHGYVPFNRALQFSHNFQVGGRKVEINEFEDGRASLAEILSVKGAIKTVDWRSATSMPDKIVQAAANQTVNFLWPGASISKSIKPENSFFLDVKNIPLSTNVLLDREDEIQPIRYEFGASGAIIRGLSKVAKRLTNYPSLATHEVYGFKSDSTPISGDRNQHLRNLYKNLRDYWISPFDTDSSRYPYDIMRTMRFMFSRDDRPNGFVNEKMKHSFEKVIGISRDRSKTPEQRKNSVAKWKDWLQGYITYDLLMRSVYYLLKPDFRNVRELKKFKVNPDGSVNENEQQAEAAPEKIEEVYNTLDFSNFENLLTTTIAGAQLVNASQLMYVINQSILLQQQFPTETKKIIDSGYKLFEDGEAPNSERAIYTHRDLLRLAQEFQLGEGYHYVVQQDTNHNQFMQLERDKNRKPTLQWLVDRLTLLSFLFKRDQLHLQK